VKLGWDIHTTSLKETILILESRPETVQVRRL